ncbi:MAG: N(4)-(beta-N-acetylglucosaminyl)-L-asparaginase [Saprospiraceae bacterium]|nr:N(4)-(beta-N-acetylglucosaminyl)-L-asparaginase [Saprospiraceae bacterium]
MLNRRSFFNHSLTASFAAFLGFTQCESPAQSEDAAAATPSSINPNSKAITPAIIATWPHQEATAPAMEVIQEGRSALDAVEACARIVEADPKDQSVGYGGLPDAAGDVTLDACIMAADGKAGAVTYLQHIKHPISVARKVMEETIHVMLSGEGAYQFALEQGFEKEDLLTPKSKEKWEKWKAANKGAPAKANIDQHDTIGVLAIDKEGNMSGACTTSGMAYKIPGRVGDSPIIGAGLYVDNEVGGACATGVGELVMTTLGSFLVVELMRQGKTPQEACEAAVQRIADRHLKEGNDLQVGFVAMNKKGEHGAYSILNGFSYTLHQDDKNEVHKATFMMKNSNEQ